MSDVEYMLLNAVSGLVDEMRLLRNDRDDDRGKPGIRSLPKMSDVSRKMRLQEIADKIQAEIDKS